MAAPNSATESAPKRLTTPPAIHTIKKSEAEPVNMATAAGTMNIPDPMIPPALIMVASSRESTRFSFG